jgi:TonB family protein
MRQRSATRARGFLSRGALLSVLVHVNLLVPIGIAAWVYGGREEAQRAEEVDVAFQDATAEDLPKDLPPLEPPTDELPPLAAESPPEKKKPERKLTPQEQKEQKQEKKKHEQQPEPEVVVPPQLPPPPEETPPPPPPERRSHEKMVDLDNDKEVEAPKDAKFLAQKNNRADEETRATDTNLEKTQKGEATPSAPSERKDEQVGAEKETIAETEQQKSLLGRKAPDVTPHVDPQLAQPKDQVDPAKRSLLALRDPAPKVHELTPETADLSLPRAPDGDISEARRAVRGDKSDPARMPPGKTVKLALSGKDYEYLFGADAEADRRLAEKQMSAKQGKFQQKLARVRAALENFIPEVKPGNTTALNTRAAPFAAYIARMHRSIHKLWGFGQIEDWDEKSSSSPFNNMNLMTNLELVLNRDGTVEKVTVVQSSGYLPYDAAAIDVAYTAGPYPDPPKAIRSPNGKIYVHWRFYRDDRQCATSGVDYFILDDGKRPVDDPDERPSTGSAAPGAPRPLAAATRANSGTTAPAVAAPGAASTTSGNGGLRRLERFDDSSHRAGMQRLDAAVAAAEQQEGTTPAVPASTGQGGGAAARRSTAAAEAARQVAPKAADPVARAVAKHWFAALAAGNASSLADTASFPFKTSDKDVTSRASLSAMLGELASEGTPKADSVQIFTVAGLRAAIGKLPPNLDDSNGAHLYAVASNGPQDTLILVLSEQPGGWKASGLVRR